MVSNSCCGLSFLCFRDETELVNDFLCYNVLFFFPCSFTETVLQDWNVSLHIVYL